MRGRVWLPNGSPAVDATVTLIDTPKRVRITDQEGRFAIQGADLDEDSKLHVFHAQPRFTSPRRFLGAWPRSK